MTTPASNTAFAEQANNEDIIQQVFKYLSLIQSYYKQILGFSGVITLGAFLFSLSLSPVYQSTVSILIESNEAKAVSVQQIVSIDKSQRAYYKTQYEVLKSRQLAEKVADSIQLSKHPLYRKKNLSNKQLAPSLIGGLSVSPLRGTYLVYITYKSQDPELAAQVANAYAQAYIDNHLDSKLTATVKAQSWLSERLSSLKLKLEDSERKLRAYREQENLLDVNGVKSVAISQHEQISSQLIEVRKNKTEAQNNYDQLTSLIKSANPSNSSSFTSELLSVSNILNQPIIQQIKSQESALELKIAELSNRYGPLHPKMKSAKSELISIQKKLELQVKDLVRVYEKELQVYKQTERSLLEQIQGSNSEIKRINNKNFELSKLEREVEVNQELYDLFLTRESETLGISGFETPPARILDPASVPGSPILLNKRLIVVGAFFISLLIACALVVLYDILDNTIKTPNDVEQKLSSHLLGILPLEKTLDNSEFKGAYKGFIEDSKSSFSESVRTIRTGLILSALNEKSKIIVISSSIPGEGKSTLTTNLAATLGQMKKTLIIDADLRRPSMGTTFELSKSTSGLSNIISGTHTLEDCILKEITEGVDLLVAGVIPPNPLELISSPQFKALLDSCADQYEHIVIDSAPIQSVSDSLVLSQFADLFIYVVKADATSATLAKKGLERLRQSSVKVAGVVLNQVDVENNLYYSSNHYGGYYESEPYTSHSKEDV